MRLCAGVFVRSCVHAFAFSWVRAVLWSCVRVLVCSCFPFVVRSCVRVFVRACSSVLCVVYVLISLFFFSCGPVVLCSCVGLLIFCGRAFLSSCVYARTTSSALCVWSILRTDLAVSFSLYVLACVSSC